MKARTVLARVVMATVVSATMTGFGAAAAGKSGFFVEVSRISPRLEQRMTGSSWHRGCPVPIRRLRLVRVSYHGFDRRRHIGKLVVNKDAVAAVAYALPAMYRRGFK